MDESVPGNDITENIRVRPWFFDFSKILYQTILAF